VTVVPLPDTPCVRVRMIFNEGTTGEGGNRLYLSYSGSAPSGANCTTLAGDIAGAWGTHLAPLVNDANTLDEVDVLDIATDSGLSGQWTGSTVGTRTGSPVAASIVSNIEFGIARRYRGGKPRMYLPGGTVGDFNGLAAWDSSFVSALNSGVAAFFAEVVGFSVGSMGTLAHVNLSYYKGFTNITNSSGRERAVPTYRSSALHDPVTGYFAKTIIGSQKRRRTSTTP
jgi:hypothetical protein